MNSVFLSQQISEQYFQPSEQGSSCDVGLEKKIQDLFSTAPDLLITIICVISEN
jgi:hypothetical protein